jgi:hypothetical protein
VDVLEVIRAARAVPVLRGAAPVAAARAGNTLAAEVVAAPGALLPPERGILAPPEDGLVAK